MTSKSTEMSVDVGAAFRLIHKKLDCHCPSYGPQEDDRAECSNCKALAVVAAALEELAEAKQLQTVTANALDSCMRDRDSALASVLREQQRATVQERWRMELEERLAKLEINAGLSDSPLFKE